MFLDRKPRISLATLPTPLQEASRLRAALGGSIACPRILIKRDDLTGFGLGGNKARKLEFLVADALHQNATILVTSGAVQSNHARMTAAAACAVGLRCALVLTARASNPSLQGNYLLDLLFNAEVHLIPADEDPTIAVSDVTDKKIDEVIARLAAEGQRPYLIPVGGSSPVGAFGYVVGTREILQQLKDRSEQPTRLYYASGSRATQAGLVLGAKMFGAPYSICGVAVSSGEPEKLQRAMRIANQAAELLGTPQRIAPDDLHTDQQQVGAGYGIATEAGLEAIRLLARHEGILLDPVYTSKGMAGMIADIRAGKIKPNETVIFLHTGGFPAIFADPEIFLKDLPKVESDAALTKS